MHKNKSLKSVLFLQSMQTINSSEVAWEVCQGEFMLQFHISFYPDSTSALWGFQLIQRHPYKSVCSHKIIFAYFLSSIQTHSCKAYKGNFGWLGVLLFAGWALKHVDDKGQRMGDREPAPTYQNPSCAFATFHLLWTGRQNMETVQERSFSSYFKPS